jgi:glycosyltransferase involved in cell wall biosynthesis
MTGVIARPIDGPIAGKRIGLLTAFASRAGGGVFEAVVAQAGLIRDLGGEPHVFALDDQPAAADLARFGGAVVRLSTIRGPRQIGFAPALVTELLAARLDALHLHGIWMYPSRAGAQWAKQTGRPYFVSPHGMLDRWITARGRWKKALARTGYERDNWRRASAFHALTVSEANDIERESGRTDSLVIPNSGPDAMTGPVVSRAPLLLYIGRVHPKKNLVALVEGWRMATRPPGARLVIAGWGDATDVEVLRAAVGQGDGSVEFLGPIYGEAKQALLDSARFVVLPSLSEGLPMAILEAWSAGTPVVMTADCHLDEGFATGAALRCGHAPDAIAVAINAAFAADDTLWRAMSQAALALARGHFSASAVAQCWGRAYGDAIAAMEAVR